MNGIDEVCTLQGVRPLPLFQGILLVDIVAFPLADQIPADFSPLGGGGDFINFSNLHYSGTP